MRFACYRALIFLFVLVIVLAPGVPGALQLSKAAAISAPAAIVDQTFPSNRVAATQDGTIDQSGLAHDSRDPLYRNPAGAVTTGTTVTMAKLFDETLALVAVHVPEVDVQFARRWYRQHRPVTPSS